MTGKTGIRCRTKYYIRQGHRFGKSVRLYEGVRISGSGSCQFDDKSTIYSNTTISIGKNGEFRIGKDSHLGVGCYILVGNGKVEIGDGVAIGPHTILIAHSNKVIGRDPIIDHEMSGSIKIEDDVFLGAGVIVLPNINLAAHSVVGAGSVVTNSTQEWTIYAGNPARIIRSRE